MNIKAKQSILDKIEIASPCTASWENMKGDALIRDCSQCQLSVYNISEMSKEEAEKLIQEHEGRLCIRLYRRFDGTVITNDCPIGLRKIQQSLKTAVRAAATVLSFFLSVFAVQAENDKSSKDIKQTSSSCQQTASNQQTKSEPSVADNKKPILDSFLPIMGNYAHHPKTPLVDKASQAPSIDKKVVDAPRLQGASMGTIAPTGARFKDSKTPLTDKSK